MLNKHKELRIKPLTRKNELLQQQQQQQQK